jgi:hypothetical protein
MKALGGFGGIGWVLATLCAGTAAGAEEPVGSDAPGTAAAANPTPASPAQPPDLVRLKDGSLFRGTIAELRANDKVVIVLVTGEVRTFAMSEVEFAGPSTEAPDDSEETTEPEAEEPVDAAETPEDAERPSRPRKLARVKGEEVTLKLRGAERGLTYYLKIGKSYERICTTPCEAWLPRGSYFLGVSRGSGSPVAVEQTLRLNGDVTLTAVYHDYGGTRGMGVAAYVLGGVGSAALLGIGAAEQSSELMTASAVVGLLGILVGTAGVLASDQASVLLESNRSARIAPTREERPRAFVAGAGEHRFVLPLAFRY